MIKPNLFTYATTELSQDAFICWLIEWSKKEYSDFKELHRTSIHFLEVLFKKCSLVLPEIETIKICKQDKNIDILVVVNSIYAIIIEDKTNTDNHSNQLERYFNTVTETYQSENIIPIYLKTGFQSKFNISNYKSFVISDFIEVLEYGIEQGVDNDIFHDYYEKLKENFDFVMSYNSIAINDWNHSDRANSEWIGFFSEIQKIFEKQNKEFEKWYYRDNFSGGFWSFYWLITKMIPDKDITQFHIGINQNEKNALLEIYISMVEDTNEDELKTEKRKIARNKYSKLVLDKAKELNINLIKPRHFGNGKNMTIAVYSDFVIKQNENCEIDFSYIESIIKNTEFVINSLEL